MDKKCPQCGQKYAADFRACPYCKRQGGSFGGDAKKTDQRSFGGQKDGGYRPAGGGSSAGPFFQGGGASSGGGMSPELKKWLPIAGAALAVLILVGVVVFFAVRAKKTNTEHTTRSALVNIGAEEATTKKVSQPKKGSKELTLKLDNTVENGMRLTWNKLADAELYRVYLVEENGEKRKLTETKDQKYTHTGLSAGKTYTYLVEAFNKRMDEVVAQSQEVSGKAVGAPEKPVGLEAVPSDDRAITLTWSACEGATSYKIYRTSENSSSFSPVGEVEVTSYTDRGLQTGAEYSYKVVAVSTDGTKNYESPYSEAVHCAAAGKPAAPGGVRVTETADHALKFTWSSVREASSYIIYRCANSERDYVQIATSSTPEYTDKKVTGGVTYYYKVVAVQKIGSFSMKSDQSDPAKGTPTKTAAEQTTAKPASSAESPTLTPPAGLEVNAITSGPDKGLRLTWRASRNATKYNIYRYDAKKDRYVYIFTSSELAYIDRDVTVGVRYSYRVLAYNESMDKNNLRGWCDPVDGILIAPPPVPSGLSCESKSSGRVRITWKSCPGATNYYVYRFSDSYSSSPEYLGTVDSPGFTDNEAYSGQTYGYLVSSAMNTSQWNEESEMSEPLYVNVP